MNIPIYPGSSSFTPGNTPFGFYDYDYQFQIDADKVVTFCALVAFAKVQQSNRGLTKRVEVSKQNLDISQKFSFLLNNNI